MISGLNWVSCSQSLHLLLHNNEHMGVCKREYVSRNALCYFDSKKKQKGERQECWSAVQINKEKLSHKNKYMLIIHFHCTFIDQVLHCFYQCAFGQTAAPQGGERSIFSTSWGWVVLFQNGGDCSGRSGRSFPLSSVDLQGGDRGAERRKRWDSNSTWWCDCVTFQLVINEVHLSIHLFI